MTNDNLQILDRAFYAELRRESEYSKILEGLSRPSELSSAISIAVNWIAIFATVELLSISMWFAPLALLIIGSRQRGLSNIVHDASHGNLAKKKSANDFLTNIFCAMPMLETVAFYRASHMKHHLFLGDLEKDPDAKNHLRYGYNDQTPPSQGYLSVALSLIFNQRALLDSVFGSFFSLRKQDQLKIILWWSLLLTGLALVTGHNFALLFLGLWFFSKITSYNFIRQTAEFLDHSGLKVGSKMSFTRTVSGFPLVRAVIHPNADNFHLIHHLLPKIPHYNLADAHNVLKTFNSYSIGHHCDGYVLGEHSALKSWVGAERSL